MIVVILIGLFLGCRSNKKVHTELYKITAPPNDWDFVESGGADYAWYHSKIGGTIYVDSNCSSQFEDRPLQNSIQSLLAGVGSGPVQMTSLLLDGREALFAKTLGNLDGVEVEIGMFVMSKNQCLYDFVYIAPQENFQRGLQDFNGTVYSFTSKMNTDALPNIKAPKEQVSE